MYKFINKNTIKEFTDKFIILNGKQISYPSDNTLFEAGYKPIVEDEDLPIFNPEEEMIDFEYEEKEDKIIKHFVISKIPSFIEEEIINE